MFLAQTATYPISDSDFIAGLALVVSVISVAAAIASARFAKWTVAEAKRANEIDLHHERLKVFQAFREFNYEIAREPSEIGPRVLSPLNEAVVLSEFYFSYAVHEAMKKMLIEALKLRSIVWRLKEGGTQERQDELWNKSELALKKCQDIAGEIEPLLKEDLRLHQPKGWPF